ncbi:MAG: aldo/keto reductase [Dehalococcoidia bacterium]|nr:aldo/keto reductase [Dehalococcoidia bacterium]
MEYRQLGNSGLKVSTVGLGTNNFGGRIDADRSAAVLRQAVEVGINFIDTSNSYGRGLSEEYIGRVMGEIRSRVLIATKVASAMGEGPNSRGTSRHHIMEQVEVSLRRLQTDHIDLYQIHFPDSSTPIEETLRALDDLVHQGKVRYIGCSNFAAWQVCEAIWVSRLEHLTPFVSVQPEYNLLSRGIERELVPLCQAYSIGIIPYVPLAGGFLTGKYRQGEAAPEGTRLAGNVRAQERTLTERNYAYLSKLEGFAAERGHPMAELAVTWLLGNPAVSSVIAGATRPEQVVENARACDWHLTPEEMKAVDALPRDRT